MRGSTVARVYAETLLRLAEREGAVESVSESLGRLAGIIGGDRRLARFLEAPQIPAEGKRSLLRAAFEGALHPIVVRFLELVAARHREPLLLEIAAAWNQLLDQRANRQAAIVTTAAGADPALLERLRAALEKAVGKTIAVEERVDSSLLGGIVVRTGDLVMDASLKTRLATLRGRLRPSGRAYA